MDYLRQMSFEEERRTIFHDLITPHRSYAFKVKGDSVVVACVLYTSLGAYANTDASLPYSPILESVEQAHLPHQVTTLADGHARQLQEHVLPPSPTAG